MVAQPLSVMFLLSKTTGWVCRGTLQDGFQQLVVQLQSE